MNFKWAIISFCGIQIYMHKMNAFTDLIVQILMDKRRYQKDVIEETLSKIFDQKDVI